MKITRVETFKYWIQWCNWLSVKVLTDEGMRVASADGFFELPTGPGLGTDPRQDVLAERSFRPKPPARTSESLWH